MSVRFMMQIIVCLSHVRGLVLKTPVYFYHEGLSPIRVSQTLIFFENPETFSWLKLVRLFKQSYLAGS